MFIDKASITIKDIASGDESRYVINYVLVKNDVSIATDGKILIEVDNPKNRTEEYPATEGLLNIKDKDMLIHKNTLERVDKIIPKKTTLPILKNAIVCSTGKTDEFSIYTTDLVNPQVITQKIEEGEYPKYEQLYTQKKSVTEITLSISVLNRLVKTLSKINKTGNVRLLFYGDGEPVKFESNVDRNKDRKVKGLIMPIKAQK